MRVLYFGTYDKIYLHNRLMIDGLRAAGVDVIECHVPLWHDTDDKVAAASGRRWLSLMIRAVQSYAGLLRAYLPLRNAYDVMMLGYAGHFDVFPARVLTWLSNRPLVLDILMSPYLIATERQLAMRNVLRWIEYVAYRFPDLLVIDTLEYAQWFEKTFGIPKSHFHLVSLGADERLFKPVPHQSDGTFRVMYYGTFIPLHGIEVIIQSANLLRANEDIHFQLIGEGPERAKAETLASKLHLDRVTFTNWVRFEDLPECAAQADVLLGVFGTTEQSKRTVQNKIYQGLAMAKPVITGDSPAVRAALNHRQHIYLVERGNPTALADAILELKASPSLRSSIAEEGHRLFMEKFTLEAIGRQARGHLEQLLIQGK